MSSTLRMLTWVLPALSACQLQTRANGGMTAPTVQTERTSQTSPHDRTSGASTARNVTVPDVTGMMKSDAQAALRAAGLQGEMRIGNDPGSVDFATAKICNQTPGGGQISSSSLFVAVRFCLQDAVVVGVQLVGLAAAEARKRAKAAGFTGTIEVIELGTFSPTCDGDTVCGIYPEFWKKDLDSKLTLYVNKKVTIVVPE